MQRSEPWQPVVKGGWVCQWTILAVAALLGATAGCIDTRPASERNRVVVLAADILRPGLEAAITGYGGLGTGDDFEVRFGSSAEIGEAADEGAGDLVLTAHPTWADVIAEHVGVLARAPLAGDRLVVVGPGGTALEDADGDPSPLLEPGLRIAIPSTTGTAVGMIAREALLRYGIWSRIEERLKTYANSDLALAAFDAGEVDMVITSASVAARGRLPIVVALDPAYHRPMLFEVLLLRNDKPAARSLFDHLVSSQGREDFIVRGYLPPPDPDEGDGALD